MRPPIDRPSQNPSESGASLSRSTSTVTSSVNEPQIAEPRAEQSGLGPTSLQYVKWIGQTRKSIPQLSPGHVENIPLQVRLYFVESACWFFFGLLKTLSYSAIIKIWPGNSH